MISITPDKKTLKHFQKLLDIEDHLSAALASFTRSIADTVHDELEDVKAAAADYSDLKVIHFGEVNKYSVTALVLPESIRTLNSEDEWRTAVNVIPTDPKNRDQLALKHGGPWLAEMLPSWAADSVRIVSRRISIEEADALVEKIASDPPKLAQLVYWGKVKEGSSPASAIEQVRKLAFPLGLEVTEDIAWRVLRQEFGLGGEASVPHWRRIAKDADRFDRELLRVFWRNLLGEKIDAPDIDTALLKKMRPVEAFQAFVSGDKELP